MNTNTIIRNRVERAIRRNLGELAYSILKADGSYLSRKDYKLLLSYMFREKYHVCRVYSYIFLESVYRDELSTNAEPNIFYQMLKGAVHSSQPDIVQYVLNRVPIHTIVDFFNIACVAEDIAVAMTLLGDSRIMSYHEQRFPFIVCQLGLDDLLSILLANPKIDPGQNNSTALLFAVTKGYTSIVRQLLANGKVHLAADDNYILRRAARHGWIDILKLLMEDERIDLTRDDNFEIRIACDSIWSVEYVRMLLAVPAVNPGAKNNAPIQMACYTGQADIVKLLLADSRVDPTACSNTALRMACEKGRIPIVELLLADSRVMQMGLDSRVFETFYPGHEMMNLIQSSGIRRFDSGM